MFFAAAAVVVVVLTGAFHCVALLRGSLGHWGCPVCPACPGRTELQDRR